MSADNGIYILQTLDGYRVVHAQAIENIYDGGKFNLQAVADYFGVCPTIVKTEKEAWAQAKIIYDEIMNDDYCPILEYGVIFLSGMENQKFPSHLVKEVPEETPKMEEDLDDLECPICSQSPFYGICNGCGYERKS